VNTVDRTSRLLGIAFLLQFVTSFSSGVFLQSAWLVTGNIGETMLKIAATPWLMQATILLDMFTALGIIFLGAMLFLTLRKENEALALTAMTFYILEGALLAASKLSAFSLLRISQDYATTPTPALTLMGQVAYESMDFVGGTLHMLVFCVGAILFYSLLYRSQVVPVALSLWGLLATFPLLIGTITQIFGYSLPFIFYLPYVPFELVIGIWLILKGTEEKPA